MKYDIPFNKPCPSGLEEKYLAEAIASGHLSGDGSFTTRCRQILESIFDSESVLLTTSCTHALEMAAILLDIQPGDEVIVPSFTFVSTVNAFVLRGAKPVFADVRFDTKNLDETKLEGLITEKTKAIVPVHYAGVGCEMDRILELSEKYSLPVVEDNAHGIFGRYKNRLLGTFGGLSTLSFHETKNLHCGEGGALVVNNPKLRERAEIIREKGTDRAKFFRGEIDKYSWVELGSSYLPSELLAAYLLAQLESRESIQKKREHIWRTYFAELADWSNANGVELPHVPASCDQSFHMFYLLMPDENSRQRLIDHLKAHGVLAVFHYLPLHSSKMAARWGCKPGDCPVTENISDRLVRLPFFNDLNSAALRRVVSLVKEFDFRERSAVAVRENVRT